MTWKGKVRTWGQDGAKKKKGRNAGKGKFGVTPRAKG